MTIKCKSFFNIIFIFALPVFFAANALANADESQENITLTGTHYDQDYIFVFNPIWEDIQGSWGENHYSLAWDSDYKIMKGQTAGVEQKVEFSEMLGQIFGEVGCGWVDLFYAASEPWILKGRFCLDQNLSIAFESEEEMKNWVEEKVATEMSVEFPEPTRVEIAGFLKRLMAF